MKLEVKKSDIWMIGRGCWKREGSFLAIECNVDTVHYDEISSR